jgi:hypothetical protein
MICDFNSYCNCQLVLAYQKRLHGPLLRLARFNIILIIAFLQIIKGAQIR